MSKGFAHGRVDPVAAGKSTLGMKKVRRKVGKVRARVAAAASANTFKTGSTLKGGKER